VSQSVQQKHPQILVKHFIHKKITLKIVPMPKATAELFFFTDYGTNIFDRTFLMKLYEFKCIKLLFTAAMVAVNKPLAKCNCISEMILLI